ncbi:MAG: hypothetical protein QCI82_04120 [Candidatus Thermoplasmatota archaeon]|nr:hypothetical protein [Candidatus Thermoplasmatota archaeon]
MYVFDLEHPLRRVMERKVLSRLAALTEQEVIAWRTGIWRIAEEIIERYDERLRRNRRLIIGVTERFSPEAISRELIVRRPDLSEYWDDEVFFRRLREETQTLLAHLRHSPGENPQKEGKD